jgi:hypothetical protein
MEMFEILKGEMLLFNCEFEKGEKMLWVGTCEWKTKIVGNKNNNEGFFNFLFKK